MLVPGIPVLGTFSGGAKDFALKDADGCNEAAGVDRVFRLTVPPSESAQVEVRLRSQAETLELNAFVGAPAVCTQALTTGVPCVGYVDELPQVTYPWRYGTRVLEYTNTTAAPQELYVVVAALSGGTGTFTVYPSLSGATQSMAGGTTCGNAPLLTVGVPTLMNLPAGATSGFSIPSARGCEFMGSNPDRVVAVDVPARSNTMVGATRVNGYSSLRMNAIAGPSSNCNSAPTCASSTSFTSGVLPWNGDFVHLANPTNSVRRFFVVIESDTVPPGARDIVITSRNAPITTSGDTCSGPILLQSADETVRVDLLSSSVPTIVDEVSCLFGGDDIPHSIVYRATVPPGQLLSVKALNSLQVLLNVVEAPSACTTTSQCVVDDILSDELQLGVTREHYVNTGATAKDVLLIFGVEDNFTPVGDYRIRTTPRLANDTCATPTVLTGAMNQLTHQDLSLALKDHHLADANGCASTAGSERTYQVTVPAGQTLVASATSDEMTMVLSLIPAASAGLCDEHTACTASAIGNTAIPGSATTLAYTNASGSAQTFILVVAADAYDGRDFSLTVRLF